MSDVFQTNGNTNFQSSKVELIVNGSSKGQVTTAGHTVGSFVDEKAKYYGIKAFSVYLDGSKLDTTQATRNLNGVGKVEIVAKDSRGSN